MAKKRRPPPDEPPDPSDDRVKFPFGETSSDGSWELDSDQEARLDDSVFESADADSHDLDLGSDSEDLGSDSEDLGGFDSEDLAGGFDPDEMSEIVDSGPSGSRLPNIPPGTSASDELSFDGLTDTSEEESLVDLGAGALISDRLGAVSPSGPLVIVDEESDEASSRYQASLVDDSIRVAGAQSERTPKAKKTRKGKRSWREEKIDPDAEVPTLSGRRRAPPPPKPSRAPLVIVALIGLLATGGVAFVLEERRKADLAAQEARLKADFEQQLGALRTANKELSGAKTLAEGALKKEQTDRSAELAKVRKTEADARAAAVAQAKETAAQERRDALAKERLAAQRAAKRAAAVELARLRADADARRATEVKRAVDAEKKRGAVALEDQAKSAEARRVKELADLRKKLENELAAATTRKEEEALAKALEAEKDDALDAVEKKKGGSVGDDVEDWDKYFEGDGGGGGDDTAVVDGDDDETLHPVDRAWKWLRENVHGSVGYFNLSHFSTGPDAGPHDLRKTRHELRVELEYRDWLIRSEDGTIGLRAVVELDARVDDDNYATGLPDTIDDEDKRRPILTTKDAYVALAIDWFEVRAGYQIYSWGTGDLLNPTDNLNPIDFADLFDTRRIPVLSYAVNLDFDTVSFELVSIPTFTRSRLPLKNKRFDLLRNSPLPIVRPDDPDFAFESMQWAGRAVAHVGGFDLSISGYTGFNDLPTATLAVLAGPPPTPVILPVFDRMHVLGADFATTLGIFGVEGTFGEVLKGIQLHGEAAHFWFEGNRVDEYLQMVIGLNYQFVDVIAEHDVSVALEYASDYETNSGSSPIPQVGLNRIFRGAILARIEYAVSENLSFEVAGALILHGPENGYLHPAAKWNVTDNLKLEVGGDVFLGPEDTFFGQFKRDGRVVFSAQVVF